MCAVQVSMRYACFTLLVWVSDLLLFLIGRAHGIHIENGRLNPWLEILEIGTPWRGVGELGHLNVGFSSHHRKIPIRYYSVAAPHTVRDLKLITLSMGVLMYFMSLTPCFGGGIWVEERNQTKLIKTVVDIKFMDP